MSFAGMPDSAGFMSASILQGFDPGGVTTTSVSPSPSIHATVALELAEAREGGRTFMGATVRGSINLDVTLPEHSLDRAAAPAPGDAGAGSDLRTRRGRRRASREASAIRMRLAESDGLDLVMETMEAAVRAASTPTAPSLVAVINATGVIVHTNLGRAPLAAVATARVAALASGYTNLECDLAKAAVGDVARTPSGDLPADRRRRRLSSTTMRRRRSSRQRPRCRTRGDHLPRRSSRSAVGSSTLTS